MSEQDTRYAAEANRLYWNDIASVSAIANRLGISRRALYDILEPQPAGVSCPACGVAAVFVNRSAVASSTARCPQCGVEMHAEISDIPGGDPSEALAQSVTQPTVRRRVMEDRRFALGGAALLGVVAGSLAVLLLSRD